MASVLHILPHPGGGGERYVQLLEAMPDFEHEQTCLSQSRSPLGAGPSIVTRRPSLRRAVDCHDLVHVHGDMAAMIALAPLRRRPGVVTTHGLSFLRRAHGVPRRIARARWSQVAKAARLIACSSRAERAELLALGGVDEKRLLVVPNGIELPASVDDRARRAVRAELGVEEDQVVGVYLGMLDRYKDPMTAVRAARLARERGTPLTLLVAGDGPLRAAVQAQAGPAVRVLGFRSDSERLLAAADAFVMPSTREGSSYALLEAMGYGLAIVTSDGAGIPELVGEAAIIAPVGDVQAFATALADLAADPARRAQLGSAARARVAERFGAERFVESMRAVYNAALAER